MENDKKIGVFEFCKSVSGKSWLLNQLLYNLFGKIETPFKETTSLRVQIQTENTAFHTIHALKGLDECCFVEMASIANRKNLTLPAAMKESLDLMYRITKEENLKYMMII